MLDLIGSKFLSLIKISQVNQDLLSLAHFDLFRNPVLEKMLKLSLNSKPIKWNPRSVLPSELPRSIKKAKISPKHGLIIELSKPVNYKSIFICNHLINGKSSIGKSVQSEAMMIALAVIGFYLMGDLLLHSHWKLLIETWAKINKA